LIGLAFKATLKRLASVGTCAGGLLSLLAAHPAQMAAITINSAPTTPKAGNGPYLISIQRNSAALPTRKAASKNTPAAANSPTATA
jgi:hypothetical protein